MLPSARQKTQPSTYRKTLSVTTLRTMQLMLANPRVPSVRLRLHTMP